MRKVLITVIVLLFLIVTGCSNSQDNNNDSNNTDNPVFTGTIKEINGNMAIVSAVLVEGNPEGDVYVDLSVNKDESFQVGDKIKVEFDGIIRESHPAQINTISVELVE